MDRQQVGELLSSAAHLAGVSWGSVRTLAGLLGEVVSKLRHSMDTFTSAAGLPMDASSTDGDDRPQ